MKNNKFLKNLPLILYDIICVILAVFLSTIIANNAEDGYTNYIYYIPYYIAGLVFLQIATYIAFNVYDIDLYKFYLKDLNMMWIADGIVVVLNIITILITGWFTILWVVFYIVIFIALSCGLRFIYRVSVIKKEEKEEERLFKEMEEK